MSYTGLYGEYGRKKQKGLNSRPTLHLTTINTSRNCYYCCCCYFFLVHKLFHYLKRHYDRLTLANRPSLVLHPWMLWCTIRCRWMLNKWLIGELFLLLYWKPPAPKWKILALAHFFSFISSIFVNLFSHLAKWSLVSAHENSFTGYSCTTQIRRK